MNECINEYYFGEFNGIFHFYGVTYSFIFDFVAPYLKISEFSFHNVCLALLHQIRLEQELSSESQLI